MIKGVSEQGKNIVNIASVIALHVDVFDPVHSKCPLLMMLMGWLILLSGQLLNDFQLFRCFLNIYRFIVN